MSSMKSTPARLTMPMPNRNNAHLNRDDAGIADGFENIESIETFHRKAVFKKKESRDKCRRQISYREALIVAIKA